MTKAEKQFKKEIKYLEKFKKYSEVAKDNTRAADNAIILLVEESMAFAWLEMDIDQERLKFRYYAAKQREAKYDARHPDRLEENKFAAKRALERFVKSKPLWWRIRRWLRELWKDIEDLPIFTASN